MASGSSGRTTNSGSKAFDFGSDDILCSYEDYGNQDGNNGIHTDPSKIPNSAKEFNKSRVARSSVFPASTYITPEETSFNEGLIATVENSMKKYTDSLMRFLEGISSRLSQLELYCYNLDKSIGEMRSDLSRDHEESESKLKSLERHIQEVHRSVQILRDKQELADTQKELAKLQLTHKESTTSSSAGGNEDRASEAKKGGGSSELNNPTPSVESNTNDQLALALPHKHQVPPPQPSFPQQPSMAPQIPPPQSSSSNMAAAYYMPHPQMTAPYQQAQDLSRMSQPQQNPTPPQVAYQQQWPPQQQIRTSSQLVYSSYHSPPEIPMPVQASSYMGTSLPPTSETLPPSYAPAARPPLQQQPLKTNTPPPPTGGDVGYMPRPPANINNNNANYMVYDAEGGRAHPHHHHHHPPPAPHFQQQQSVYPPNANIPPPQRMSMRAHPYNELIDKLVGMGYRGDHVVAVIQRMEESGQQPIDFNSVLDRLNGHSHSLSGSGSQRGWST